MLQLLRARSALSIAAGYARPIQQQVRALSALQAPQETSGNAASKKRPAKIKTFKIWRYDPEQKGQKPYSVD